MKNIYEAATLAELKQRINTLKPDSQRQWGTMDAARMLAHCCRPLEVALGDKEAKSSLMGKLMGRFVKGIVTNEKPFKPNMPTDKSFIVADSKDFNEEKQNLTRLLTRISEGGPKAMENRKHPFFGPMTPEEWSSSTYKHMDHHLRQFGA